VTDWTNRNESDPGIAILELLEYLGDLLSYYQDQVAAEARLRTRRRVAIALAVGGLSFVGLRRKMCRKEER
jgi:hypothetical protein